MKKLACYRILTKGKIILEYFGGTIDWSDIIDLKEKEMSDLYYKSNYNVIADVRDALNDLNDEQEIIKFVNFLKSKKTAIGPRKAAYITSTPNQVVNTELLRQLKGDLPINMKYVSTIESAFKWVEIDINYYPQIIKYFDENKIKLNTN